MVSFSDVGIAALLKYALVHLKLGECSCSQLHAMWFNCGAQKNGMKEKCITGEFVLGPRRRETLNHSRFQPEWPKSLH